MGVGMAICVAVLAMWGVGLIPSRFANQSVPKVQWMANWVVGLNLFCAAWGCAASFADDFSPIAFKIYDVAGLTVGIYGDRLSLTMYLLVSFVGLAVLRYAGRYLQGDVKQGRFLRWLSFTLAAVCSMVLAGNLSLFFVAWVLTSFGLHQLLTYYGDRPNAQRVAFKKFVISRLGDAFLIVAIALIYRACGTVEYAELLPMMHSNSLELIGRPELSWSAVFLVLGGLTKSAQFPFHTWLPDTMETPTPVSALMHAGVINAGGYLLIRMSFLVEKFPVAMSILVVLGGVTAAIGAAIMLTQTNVKRGLAYSTIAQMGMMMLQCGLGAFSTAFLHIIAHSLYKSYAFLSAGTLGQRSAAIRTKKEVPLSNALGSSAIILLITTLGVMLPFLGLWFQDWISLNKLPLIFIFALAVHALVQQVWVAYRSFWRVLVASLVLGGLFFGMTLLAQWYLQNSLPVMEKQFGLWQTIFTAYVGLIFMGLWGIQFLVDYAPKLPLTRKLYAHMANELYLDLIVHRCVALFSSKQKTNVKPLMIGKESHV